MKKLIFSIAFLGLIAANTAAQNSVDSIYGNPENEILFETENLSSSNLLSDFLSYVIRQQYSETRQTGWLLGLYGQSGVPLGRIRNSPARMDGIAGSVQVGGGVRYQINARRSVTASLGATLGVYPIRNGLVNNILGELSEYPLMGRPIEQVESEGFDLLAFEIALGYRFNFGKNRRFGDIGTYFEIGVFGNWGTGQYTVRFLEANNGTIDVIYANPDFTNFNAGIQISLAWNSLAIYSRYRLTDPLRNFDVSLPPLTIGMRVGF